ncbi:MAG TPA: hypothetical protein VGC93_08830 [Thermoanaerobaculia bacterium]
MTTETCHRYSRDLERIACGEVREVPDALALHLDACPECRRAFDRAAVPFAAEAFERLGAADRQRLLQVLVAGRRAAWWQRPALAAAAALLVLAAGWFVPWPRPESAPPSLVAALVEDHIRYLGRPERRSDRGRAALERELQSYVDFPVSLPAIASGHLTGARRCYLLGRRVALGFYAAGARELSYFVLPAEGVPLPPESCSARGLRCGAEGGYFVVTWERSGLVHAVVAADREAALAFAREADGGSGG